jgi:hypothetical protein
MGNHVRGSSPDEMRGMAVSDIAHQHPAAVIDRTF